MEILAEVLTGVAFLMIGTTINVEIASAVDWWRFMTVMFACWPLIFLAIYDGGWGELPVSILTISIICAIIAVIPQMWTGILVEPFLAGGLLGGLYLILYLVSHGKWVGDGDFYLAFAIGLMLGRPWLAVIALFVANLTALMVMLPFMKDKKNHMIYFGPFLVAAFVITYTFSDFFLSVI